MITPNRIQVSNDLMPELSFGHQSSDRTVISTSPHIDNRKPGPLEQKTNDRDASDAPVPATQINIPSFLKPIEKLTEQDTLLDNSAGPPAYSPSSGATSIPSLSHKLSRAERYLHELSFKGDHRAPPGIPPSTGSEIAIDDGRESGLCRVNLMESFQRAVLNCAVKRRPELTSSPELPFFLKQGKIGERQTEPSCESTAGKVCSSLQPAAESAPAVRLCYATVAASPGQPSAASGADKPPYAAAAPFPESDVSKVNLFDSFARAIANRPMANPGVVDSPQLPKCLAPQFTDFSTILLNHTRQRPKSPPLCDAVETALFCAPEAVVLTVSEIVPPPEIDTSQVQKSRRRREAARKAAAHQSKVYLTERVLSRKVDNEAAQTAQASVAAPPLQGGTDVERLPSSAGIQEWAVKQPGTTPHPSDGTDVKLPTFPMAKNGENLAFPRANIDATSPDVDAESALPPMYDLRNEEFVERSSKPMPTVRNLSHVVVCYQDVAEVSPHEIGADRSLSMRAECKTTAPVDRMESMSVMKDHLHLIGEACIVLRKSARRAVVRNKLAGELQGRKDEPGRAGKLSLQHIGDRPSSPHGGKMMPPERDTKSSQDQIACLSQEEFDSFINENKPVAPVMQMFPERNGTSELSYAALDRLTSNVVVGAPLSVNTERRERAKATAEDEKAAVKGSKHGVPAWSRVGMPGLPRLAHKTSALVLGASKSQVRSKALDVLSGNPFALLSEMPEEVTPVRNREVTSRAAGPKTEIRRSRSVPPESGAGRAVLATRKPVTLGDFLPRNGVTATRQKDRKPTLDLTALGEDGRVSDRVKTWSERDLGAEVVLGFGGRRLSKRKRPFEGLRGVVSDHIPTAARNVSWNRGARPTMVRNVRAAAPQTVTLTRVSPEQTSARNRPHVVRTSPQLSIPPNSQRVSYATVVRMHPRAQQTKDSQLESQGHLQSVPAPTSARSGSPAAVAPDAAGSAPILGGSLIATRIRGPDSLQRSGRHNPVASAEPARGTIIAKSSARSCPVMTVEQRPLTTNSESGGATGRLQLVVALGDKRVTVEVLESDWKRVTEFTEVTAENAVEWTVIKGLHRALGIRTPTRSGRYQVEPALCGNRVPDGLVPDSWESLALFIRGDGYYQASRRLRGGMDPTQDQGKVLLGQTRLSDDSVDWAALDDDLAKILRNEAAQDPIGPSRLLAQALSAQMALDQLAPLATLPDDLRARGTITPARIAALITVLTRAQLEIMPAIPKWLSSGEWAEVIINNINFDHLLITSHSSNMHDQIRNAILRILVEKIPCLRSPSTRWTRIGRKIRLEVNLREPGVFSARAQLPTGPWISELLSGSISLTEGSYVTIAPAEGFCEVELDGADSRLVRAVGQCLRAPADRLRALFNTAFRLAFTTDCVTTRTTTSLLVRGGRGHKSSVRYFAPDSDEAGFMVGMEAMVLLMARRSGPTTTLRLGGVTPLGEEYPVSIEVSLPLCPSRPMYEMVSNRSIPLFLMPAQTISDSSVVLLAPLPKGWLQHHIGPAVAKLTAAEEFLERLFQSHLQANMLVLVGRYEKQGDPIGIYVEFQSVLAANSFAAKLYASQLPAEVLFGMGQLLPGVTLEVFSSKVPVEALILLREKELMAALDKARAHPCSPPAPAPVAVDARASA